MKFFKTFIINIFLFLTIVRFGNGDKFGKNDTPGREELNTFLKNLQSKQGIAQINVIIQNEEMSIDKFFESSKGVKSNDNLWEISEEDVFRPAYLLGMVVSCKYSEYTYLWVKLIELANDTLEDGTIDKQKKNQDLFFKPIQNLLPSMIYTLIGLLKYTNNVATKQDEILRTLLSWYIYIANFVNFKVEAFTAEILENRYELIELTNYQIKRHLKLFMLHNCKSTESSNIKKNVENTLKVYENIDLIQKTFNEICDELQSLVYPKFVNKYYNEQDLFILTPTRNNFNTLVHFYGKIVSTEVLNINWNGETEKNVIEVYDSSIEVNSDIKSLLKFERIILQTITKIIIGFVSKLLKTFIETSNPTEIYEKCHEIVTILDNNIKEFKNNGQPSFLINNMSIIKADLWTECFKCRTLENKSDLKDYVDKLDQSKIEISAEVDSKNFNKYLAILTKSIICTKLHPIVSNVLWEKLYFVPTSISEYVNDYEYLYLKYQTTNTNNICEKISDELEKLTIIRDKIIECSKSITKGEAVNECFNELKSKYDELKQTTTNISETINGVFDYNWKKILIILDYNQDIYSFNEDKNDQTIKVLNKLHDQINDYFEIGSYVSCNRSPPDAEWRKETPANNPNLFADIDSYKKLFKVINEFGENIQKNSALIDVVKLFWNGSWLTPPEIHKIYTNIAVDFLHNNYDYLRFIVRWIIGVVYRKIQEVVITELQNNTQNYSWSESITNDIQSKFEGVMKLPLFIAKPVKRTLDMFVLVLRSYDGKNKTDLTNYQLAIDQELDSMGVFPKNAFKEGDTFSVSLKALIDTIDHLTSSYEAYKNRIEQATKNLGIDQNVLIMMLKEWHEGKNNNGVVVN